MMDPARFLNNLGVVSSLSQQVLGTVDDHLMDCKPKDIIMTVFEKELLTRFVDTDL